MGTVSKSLVPLISFLSLLVVACGAEAAQAPNFASMQITAAPISTKTLDYSRQGYLRNSCFSRLSGICEDKLEKMLEEAAATPTGDLRRQRIEAIADHVYEHFHFVQGFHVVPIYGLSENLLWEPHYASRIRANTMHFIQ